MDFPNREWRQRTPGFGRRFLRTAAIDVAVLAVILLVGELALRAFMPELSRAMFTKDLTGGHPKTVNSMGLRDREFPRQAPPGEHRLIAIGNSTTWGSGVALEETYPKELERRLGRGTMVINGGGEGTSLGKAQRFLEHDGVALRPEVVIIGFSPSMVSVTIRKGETASAAPPRPGLAERLLEIHGVLYNSYLYVFWDTQVRKKMYELGILEAPVNTPGSATLAYAFDVPGIDRAAIEATYDTIVAQLVELEGTLAAHGIRLIVVSIPSRFELSDDARDNERRFPLEKIRIHPAERLGHALEDHGIAFVDLLPRLRAERAAMLSGAQAWTELYIPYDHTHLDARGHAIAGEELEAALRTRGWIGQR
jgi:hypothetical protein